MVQLEDAELPTNAQKPSPDTLRCPEPEALVDQKPPGGGKEAEVRKLPPRSLRISSSLWLFGLRFRFRVQGQ